MKGRNTTNLALASYDDIFKTDEGREDALREKVAEIPLADLHPFENHPFKVQDDEAMQDMAESVMKSGVLVPGVARPRKDGGYELVAGHRRKRACELAGLETMPVLVRELDDDEAILVMVDYGRDSIDEVLELILETVCSTRKVIRIAGNDFPAEAVKSRMLKVDSSHVEYLLDCLKKNTTKVRNIKAYMLTAIYNSPVTIDSYYRAEVNHDCGARLAPFDIAEIRELMSEDELELDTLGGYKKIDPKTGKETVDTQKSALFVIISDTDASFNFSVALMYSQLFKEICF